MCINNKVFGNLNLSSCNKTKSRCDRQCEIIVEFIKNTDNLRASRRITRTCWRIRPGREEGEKINQRSPNFFDMNNMNKSCQLITKM